MGFKKREWEAYTSSSGVTDTDVSPEQRLWLAVVGQMLYDFDILMTSIEGQIKRTGSYFEDYAHDLRRLRFEMDHQHFIDCCDMASFPHSKVMALVHKRLSRSRVYSASIRRGKHVVSGGSHH